MIHTIILTAGYVESATTSFLAFTAFYPTKSKKEAVHSLAEFFYQKYLMDKPTSKTKDCCKKSSENKDNQFCPKCGKFIYEKQFDWDDFSSWITSLFRSTADDYGLHDYVPNPNGWNPWEVKFQSNNKMIIINECAEIVMCTALAEIHPELVNDELYRLYHWEVGSDVYCNVIKEQ